MVSSSRNTEENDEEENDENKKNDQGKEEEDGNDNQQQKQSSSSIVPVSSFVFYLWTGGYDHESTASGFFFCTWQVLQITFFRKVLLLILAIRLSTMTTNFISSSSAEHEQDQRLFLYLASWLFYAYIGSLLYASPYYPSKTTTTISSTSKIQEKNNNKNQISSSSKLLHNLEMTSLVTLLLTANLSYASIVFEEGIDEQDNNNEIVNKRKYLAIASFILIINLAFIVALILAFLTQSLKSIRDLYEKDPNKYFFLRLFITSKSKKELERMQRKEQTVAELKREIEEKKKLVERIRPSRVERIEWIANKLIEATTTYEVVKNNNNNSTTTAVPMNVNESNNNNMTREVRDPIIEEAVYEWKRYVGIIVDAYLMMSKQDRVTKKNVSFCSDQQRSALLEAEKRILFLAKERFGLMIMNDDKNENDTNQENNNNLDDDEQQQQQQQQNNNNNERNGINTSNKSNQNLVTLLQEGDVLGNNPSHNVSSSDNNSDAIDKFENQQREENSQKRQEREQQLLQQQHQQQQHHRVFTSNHDILEIVSSSGSSSNSSSSSSSDDDDGKYNKVEESSKPTTPTSSRHHFDDDE